MHHEEKISSEVIFTGQVFTVTVDAARLENGKAARREVVHHTGGAGVLALNADGRVALVKQYRYAAAQQLTEIPAGKIEPGEAPRATAIRELAEEAGLVAESVQELGSILPTCAYCTERIYLYLARGLTQVPRHLDEDEFVSLLWLPLGQAVEMVMDGRIDDAKTVAALLKVWHMNANGAL